MQRAHIEQKGRLVFAAALPLRLRVSHRQSFPGPLKIGDAKQRHGQVEIGRQRLFAIDRIAIGHGRCLVVAALEMDFTRSEVPPRLAVDSAPQGTRGRPLQHDALRSQTRHQGVFVIALRQMAQNRIERPRQHRH